MRVKLFIKTALISFGALTLIYAAIMAVITNFNSGVIICAMAAIALLVYGVFFEKLYSIKPVTICFCAVAGLVLCLAAFIAVYGNSDNVTYAEDAVIVLGAGINGERVTLPLAYRLDKAAEYHRKNPDAVIVVSGGQGFQEAIPEALAMERYLLSKGVAEDRIIKELNSTSTYTNFAFSKEILDKHFSEEYTTAFITNGFHVYRASRTAELVGLNCTHLSAAIQWYIVPLSYARECAAVLMSWVLPPSLDAP